MEKKSKIVAALLAIFVGGIGIHKFYLGKKVAGVLYILFCWTMIPMIIGLVEGIVYLCMEDANFDKKYNSSTVAATTEVKPQQVTQTPVVETEVEQQEIKTESVVESAQTEDTNKTV